MNKQSLYLMGGALLASTALTSISQGATLKSYSGAAATTALAARPLATEVFGSTAAADAALVIGSSAAAANGTGAPSTANNSLLVAFTFPVVINPFRVDLDITSGNATFAGANPIVIGYDLDTSNTVAGGATLSGCTVQPTSTKIIISGCATTGNAASVDAIGIIGLSFSGAAGLAVAGTSIELGGSLKDSAGSIIDTITPAAFITSRSAVKTASIVAATTGLTISATVTPAYTGNSTSSAVDLGTINYSTSNAMAADLSHVMFASSLVSTTEVKITHGVLSDDAFASLNVAGTSFLSSVVVSGSVTFSIEASSLNNAVVSVRFNGTKVVDTTSGTATAVVTNTAEAPTFSAVSISGNLAHISTGGLSTSFNSVLPSAMGSQYQAFIRVTNSSGIAGTATFNVYNDVTGVKVGSTVVSSALTAAIALGRLGAGGVVPAGSTFMISVPELEAAIGGSVNTGYRVDVTTMFTGYGQSVVWNSASGVLTDQSGFRNGSVTVAP